jgi:hypothetical protein
MMLNLQRPVGARLAIALRDTLSLIAITARRYLAIGQLGLLRLSPDGDTFKSQMSSVLTMVSSPMQPCPCLIDS